MFAAVLRLVLIRHFQRVAACSRDLSCTGAAELVVDGVDSARVALEPPSRGGGSAVIPDGEVLLALGRLDSQSWPSATGVTFKADAIVRIADEDQNRDSNEQDKQNCFSGEAR